MGVEVKAVSSKRDLKQFVKLPFSLYKGDPNWVPPLISERMRFLNRSKNPFFEHAEAELFIAWRDGKPVGRIAASIDSLYDKIYGGTDGNFGFFESIDDQEVTVALLDSARKWLRSKGRTRMLGPFDFNTNHECGLLVEGNDMPPYILMTYHPSYYQGLLEAQGLTKSMDLLEWKLTSEMIKSIHPAIVEGAKKSQEELGVTIREFDKKDFEGELLRFFDLYNAAWEKNWGFVPLTEAELRFMAHDMKQIIEPKITLFAEKDGTVMGSALCLPNINEILPKLNGRLFPFGWLKFLLGLKKIKTLRVFTLGVKPEYQHTGIAAALYVNIRDNAISLGIHEGEMGWILETNGPMNSAMEGMGGKIVKRYRIFEQAI